MWCMMMGEFQSVDSLTYSLRGSQRARSRWGLRAWVWFQSKSVKSVRVRDRPFLLTFLKSGPLLALAKELPTVHSVVGVKVTVDSSSQGNREGQKVLFHSFYTLLESPQQLFCSPLDGCTLKHFPCWRHIRVWGCRVQGIGRTLEKTAYLQISALRLITYALNYLWKSLEV